jgi:hypothetical protein
LTCGMDVETEVASVLWILEREFRPFTLQILDGKKCQQAVTHRESRLSCQLRTARTCTSLFKKSPRSGLLESINFILLVIKYSFTER